MKVRAIVEAQKQAKTFLSLADVVIRTKGSDEFLFACSPKDTGALRRASMELTRALAEMRKP